MENFGLSDVAALLFGLAIFVALGYLLTEDARRARALYHFIMSRLPAKPAGESVPELVHVPVGATGSSEVVPLSTNGEMPDTDAVDAGTEAWAMPPVSRYLDDRAIVVLLAAQKRSGKYRFSANQIVQIIGGSRADTLAIVRAIREAPAPFPEKTPEQIAAREALGLDQV